MQSSAYCAGASRWAEPSSPTSRRSHPAILFSVFLLFFGALKWTPAEANGMQPLAGHSPFLFWLYPAFGVRIGSELDSAPFLLKDLTFLGAAIWTAGEALSAIRSRV